jgi:15-cis-phytoene synthase
MLARSLGIGVRTREVAAAFAETDRVTRANSRTFYLATALLLPPARRAIRALYAFCRASDDLVDRGGATLAEVERWRAEAARPAAEQREPILLAWSQTRERYGVDPRFQEALLDGICLDLTQRRYATGEELERYCYLVASTVGLLSMPVIGLASGVRFEQAAPYAIQLGVALQLTNILRDVGEDAANGRVYLPQTDLAHFGLAAEDILRGVHDERFVALMKFESERARRLYAAALPGIALLAPAARPAVGAAALLYRAILDQIEAIGWGVHTQRASTSGSQKVRLLPGILWQVLALRPPPAGHLPLPADACMDGA